MKHFRDCLEGMKTYDICTCDMCGAEMYLVDLAIKKQEGRIKWWHFFDRMTVNSAPEIPKFREKLDEI